MCPTAFACCAPGSSSGSPALPGWRASSAFLKENPVARPQCLSSRRHQLDKAPHSVTRLPRRPARPSLESRVRSHPETEDPRGLPRARAAAHCSAGLMCVHDIGLSAIAKWPRPGSLDLRPRRARSHFSQRAEIKSGESKFEKATSKTRSRYKLFLEVWAAATHRPAQRAAEVSLLLRTPSGYRDSRLHIEYFQPGSRLRT